MGILLMNRSDHRAALRPHLLDLVSQDPWSYLQGGELEQQESCPTPRHPEFPQVKGPCLHRAGPGSPPLLPPSSGLRLSSLEPWPVLFLSLLACVSISVCLFLYPSLEIGPAGGSE